MTTHALVISCEHAVNTVPPAYQHCFAKQPDVLHTHAAIDLGAADIANYLVTHTGADYQAADITRLLIDCNRSLTHPTCFSRWSEALSDDDKNTLIACYYIPYRNAVIQCIEQHIQQGRQVTHLSIHSFTPILDGVVRHADIGLLYDPKRKAEKEFAHQVQKKIAQQPAPYRVQLNYPYKGTSDGFTTALRKRFDAKDYLGIEIESNQAITTNPSTLSVLQHTLLSALIPDRT